VTSELLQAITYLQIPHVGLTIDQHKIQTTDDKFDVVFDVVDLVTKRK